MSFADHGPLAFKVAVVYTIIDDHDSWNIA